MRTGSGSQARMMNGSHCRHAAAETSTRASRRSRRERCLPQASVDQAMQMPTPRPARALKIMEEVGASSVSSAAPAAPAAPTRQKASRMGRRENTPSRSKMPARPVLASTAQASRATLAAMVAQRNTGSCTSQPFITSRSLRTPSKQKSRSIQANRNARPSQVPALVRRDPTGKNEPCCRSAPSV